MKDKIQLCKKNKDKIWSDYTNMLFKKGVPMPFVDKTERNFMGIIQDVTATGKLQILLENDAISEFEIKEIKMLY